MIEWGKKKLRKRFCKEQPSGRSIRFLTIFVLKIKITSDRDSLNRLSADKIIMTKSYFFHSPQFSDVNSLMTVQNAFHWMAVSLASTRSSDVNSGLRCTIYCCTRLFHIIFTAIKSLVLQYLLSSWLCQYTGIFEASCYWSPLGVAFQGHSSAYPHDWLMQVLFLHASCQQQLLEKCILSSRFIVCVCVCVCVRSKAILQPAFGNLKWYVRQTVGV